MTRILFVGLLPPDSHNPEERRFVEELTRHAEEVRYVRGIGIKGFKSPRVRSIFGRRPILGAPKHVPRLLVIPPRGLLRRFNVNWLRRQLQRLTPDGAENWILWTRFPSPELVEAIEIIPFHRVVYEPIDRYDASLDFSGSERHRLGLAEARLIRRATVIAGSSSLARRFGHAAGGSTWLPFGRDCDAAVAVQKPYLSDGHRRVGVVAEFDWRVDDDLLSEVAQHRPHWRIVLVGPRSKSWGRALRRLDNVDCIGRVDSEAVPDILRSFDVALIPYVVNDWTRACLPVKVFEYLAQGLPVVSSALPELAPLSDVIGLASRDGFVQAVDAAMASDTPFARRTRVEASTRFSLQDRARRAMDLLTTKSLVKASP